MIIFRPICWFWEVWHNLPFLGIDGYWVSAGHEWVEQKNSHLKYERCGGKSL